MPETIQAHLQGVFTLPRSRLSTSFQVRLFESRAVESQGGILDVVVGEELCVVLHAGWHCLEVQCHTTLNSRNRRARKRKKKSVSFSEHYITYMFGREVFCLARPLLLALLEILESGRVITCMELNIHGAGYGDYDK